MANEQQAFPRLDTPLVDSRTGIISIPWYRLLISLWNRTGGASGDSGVPSGLVCDWAGPLTAIPDGWFYCDGTAVSRTTFSTLFSIIGIEYGAGDGSTTFNLPDARNRVIVGTGTFAVGDVGGSSSVVLSVGQLPAHSHNVTDPGHAHTQQVRSNNTAGTTGSQGANAANATSVGTTDSAVTGITLQNTGNGDAISIWNPYIAMGKIIKT
jgi:microcystin-dependent protein